MLDRQTELLAATSLAVVQRAGGLDVLDPGHDARAPRRSRGARSHARAAAAAPPDLARAAHPAQPTVVLRLAGRSTVGPAGQLGNAVMPRRGCGCSVRQPAQLIGVDVVRGTLERVEVERSRELVDRLLQHGVPSTKPGARKAFCVRRLRRSRNVWARA